MRLYYIVSMFTNDKIVMLVFAFVLFAMIYYYFIHSKIEMFCNCGMNKCTCGMNKCGCGMNKCTCGMNKCTCGMNKCSCGMYHTPNIGFKCPYNSVNGVSSPIGSEIVGKKLITDYCMPFDSVSTMNGIIPVPCECSHMLNGSNMDCGYIGKPNCEGYRFTEGL